MKQEERIDFNRRIIQSNPSQLICIFYEMYFVYQTDALEALETEKQEDYVQAIRSCIKIVEHLRSVLDFNYEISVDLYALYTLVQRLLSKAMYRKHADEIKRAGSIMSSLQEAFVQVAKTDEREPMMGNTQQVMVGLTYGKNRLNESVAKDIGTRGFWV